MPVVLPPALHDALASICQKFSDGGAENTQVVRYKDDIVSLCTEHRYGSYRRWHCKQIACHPKNRDNQGIHLKRAHSRISRIKMAGCSEDALRPNRIAIEDNPFTKHIEKFNVDISAQHEEYAQYRKGEVEAGTLGASHTNHGMAQLYDQRPCDVEGISEMGIMSHNLCFQDELLKKYTLEGMDWFTIKWEIEEVFPLVPIIIQAALNTVTQMTEGENWCQLLCKIAKECQAQKTSNGDINVKKVQIQVVKSQPPRAQDVPDMVEFVRTWGGLPSAFHINEINTLAQTLPSDRVVSGSFFKWLASTRSQFSVTQMPSHFINAVLYTHAASNDMVQDDISRYITKPEVASFTSKAKLQYVMQADGILKRGAKLADKLSKRDYIRIIPDFKVSVVLCVLARKSHQEKDNRSLDQIAECFAKSVCELLGVAPQGMVPNENVQDKSTVVNNTPRNVVLYNDEGEVSDVGRNTIINRGFRDGMQVMKKLGKEKCVQWVIKIIEDDGTVSLSSIDIDGKIDDHVHKIDIDIFLQDYKEASPIEVVTHYPMSDATNCAELQMAALKGQIQACVAAMTSDTTPQPVTIMTSPERKVVCRKAFDVKQLSFVPSTMSITLDDGKKSAPPKSILSRIEGLDHRILLNQMPNTKEFTAVFWNLRITSTKKDANMQLEPISYRYKMPSYGDKKSAVAWMVFHTFKAVNMKGVAEMDELILFRPSAEKDDAKRKNVSAVIEAAPSKKKCV